MILDASNTSSYTFEMTLGEEAVTAMKACSWHTRYMRERCISLQEALGGPRTTLGTAREGAVAVVAVSLRLVVEEEMLALAARGKEKVEVGTEKAEAEEQEMKAVVARSPAEGVENDSRGGGKETNKDLVMVAVAMAMEAVAAVAKAVVEAAVMEVGAVAARVAAVMEVGTLKVAEMAGVGVGVKVARLHEKGQVSKYQAQQELRHQYSAHASIYRQ